MRTPTLTPWLAPLAFVLAALAGCASTPPSPTPEQAEQPWRLEAGAQSLALRTGLRPAFYRVCQDPDSGGAVAVWTMDRTLGLRLAVLAHRLEPGRCVVAQLDWEQRIVLRPAGGGAAASGTLTRLRLDYHRLGVLWPHHALPRGLPHGTTRPL